MTEPSRVGRRRGLLVASLATLVLVVVPELPALTPEEADRAIQIGLRAKAAAEVPDFFVVTKFSSIAYDAAKFAGGTRGEEYSLLIRSCRQFLQFEAFRSKKDRSIDLEAARASCIEQDRVWVALDAGGRDTMPSGLFGRLLRTKRRTPMSRVDRIEVILDDVELTPTAEMELGALGPGSAIALYEAEPFQDAREAKVIVAGGKNEQITVPLKPSLLRQLFSQ